MTEEGLRENMETNLEFASNHSIPSFKNSYAVSPHHSGVYPVHTPLYRVWSEVANVSMTTTEEYPHLYPDYGRRGFIHMGIMVCMCITKGRGHIITKGRGHIITKGRGYVIT